MKKLRTKRERLDYFTEHGTSNNEETSEFLELMTGKKYNFGMKVRSYRHLSKLRQEDLAQKIGVSKQTVSRIESSGYLPSIEIAIKLAKVFKTPPESLLLQLWKDLCSAEGFRLDLDSKSLSLTKVRRRA